MQDGSPSDSLSNPPRPTSPPSSNPDLQETPRSREPGLRTLWKSEPHIMKLSQLQESVRAHRKDASFHKKKARRISEELHQIVSLYAILHGVVFAVVAHSTVFTCADVWGPVGALVVLTIGNIFAAVYKLRDMGREKQEVKNFEGRESAVYDRIAQLQSEGSNCNLDGFEPQRTDSLAADSGVLGVLSAHGLLVAMVFAAVAQSTIFTCADVQVPKGALVVFTIGTIIAAVNKLHDMGREKQEVKNLDRCQSAVYDKIT